MINMVAKLRGELYDAKFCLENEGDPKARLEKAEELLKTLEETKLVGPRACVSSAIFCINKGEILLIHHKLLNTWLPVGGEQEGYETPLETAIRELREETGFEDVIFPPIPGAIRGSPNGYIGYEEHDAGIKGRHMNHNFAAIVPWREVKGDGSFDGTMWVNPDDIWEVDAPDSVKDVITMIKRVLW
jgi:8-oxo-dGTP diphosphatase